MYRWSVAAQAPRVIPWLALLALLCVRANRDPRAWTVLIPPVLAKVVFIAGERMAPTEAIDAFETVVVSLSLATGMLWAGSFALASDSRRRDVLLTLAVLVPGAVLAAVCAKGLNAHATGYALTASLLGLVQFLSLLGAGFGCRRGYAPRRFVGRLCRSCVAGACTVALATVTVLVAATGALGTGMLAQLAFVLLAYTGLASGIVLAVLLSYLALPLWNSLYRERFYAAYRLPGMPGYPLPTPPPTGDDAVVPTDEALRPGIEPEEEQTR